MTILSISSRVALAAVAASLLTSAHHAEAKGGNGHMAFGAVTTGMNKPGPSPVILPTRDHRGGREHPEAGRHPVRRGSPDHSRSPRGDADPYAQADLRRLGLLKLGASGHSEAQSKPTPNVWRKGVDP